MSDLTRDQVRCAAERYLGNRHATLWADYDLSRPERFDMAVEWLTQQVFGVMDCVEQPQSARSLWTEYAPMAGWTL